MISLGTVNPPPGNGGSSNKPLWGIVLATVGAIPYIGSFLKAALESLGRENGIPLLIGGLLGIAATLLLIYFDVVPNRRAGEPVWNWIGRSFSLHPKPLQLAFAQQRVPVDWRHPFVDELSDEGMEAARQNKGGHYRFSLGIFEADLPASAPFSLVLKQSPGFDVSGYAFRATSVSPDRRLLDPLVRHHVPASSTATGELRFDLPRCEAGDQLYLVLRASSTTNPMPQDFTQTFQQFIE
jgi:hypothetical protein